MQQICQRQGSPRCLRNKPNLLAILQDYNGAAQPLEARVARAGRSFYPPTDTLCRRRATRHAECNRKEWTYSYGVHEHGRAIYHRGSRRLSEQALCMWPWIPNSPRIRTQVAAG